MTERPLLETASPPLAGPPPRVSVVLPVRDGVRWLGLALDSILGQSFDDIELLVIDDGSRDGADRLAADYARRDGRVIVQRQVASGLVAALNAGLAAARGALVARMDADDVAAPARLARQVAAFEARPELVLLGSWAREIDEAGAVRGTRRPPTSPEACRAALRRTNPFVHSAVMMRAAAARAGGGYRTAFAGAEDDDLWLRLSERGVVANLAETLVDYRVHAGSVSMLGEGRQLYAARLARRAAALRSLGDPAAEAPPADPWEATGGPYGDTAALFRLLAWADPGAVPAGSALPDLGILARLRLGRRERRLARRALAGVARALPTAARGPALLRLAALDPLRAPLHAWRLLGVPGRTGA